MRNTNLLHSTIHENSYEIYSFFQEKRAVYFAVSQYNRLNEKNISQKSDGSGAEHTKDPLEKKKIEAGLFEGEKKKLREILEALSSAEGKGERKKVEELKEKYEEVKKKLQSSNVFEAVKADVFEELTNKTKTQVVGVLGDQDKNLEAEKQESFQIVLAKVRVNKPFNKNELEHLSHIGVFECIESFSSERDKNTFLNLFAQINKGKSDFVFGVKALYASLQNDIAVILERDTVSDAQKKLIFEKFIDFTLIDEKIENTKNARAQVLKNIIEEYNLQNIDFLISLQKTLKQKIFDLVGLNYVADGEDVNSVEDNEEDSLQKNWKKEQDMLATVRKVLGKESVQNIEKNLATHSLKDFESRRRVYFELIEKEVLRRIHILKNKSLEEVEKTVTISEKMLLLLIDGMVGVSSSERKMKQKNLKNGYSAYYLYIDALKKAEKKNSNLPILEFVTNGGKTELEKQAIAELSLFTEEDITLIEIIEERQKNLVEKMISERLKYEDSRGKLDLVLGSSEYKNAKKTSSNAAMNIVRSKNILTEEGVLAICGEENAGYRPWYFKNVKSFGELYGFNEREMHSAIHLPLRMNLPKNVILKLSGKEKIESLSSCVISFFEKDNVETGIENISDSLAQTHTSVSYNAESGGNFEEGGIKEKMKQTYSKFNFEEVQEVLRRQSSAIKSVGKVVHTIIETNKNTVNNREYTDKLSEILEVLEKNNENVSGSFQNIQQSHKLFLEEKNNFSYKLSDLKNLQDNLHRINAAIGSFSELYTEEKMNVFVQEAEMFQQKDLQEQTGGKYLYQFLTKIDGDAFENSEISFAEKQLFSIMEKGNGATLEGVEEIQKLMSQKNGFGKKCITRGEKSYYDPNTNEIVLSAQVYDAIEKFDKNNEEDVYALTNDKNFQEFLSVFFHEATHSLVEKNKNMLFRFSKLLENEFGEQYKNLCNEIQYTYKKNNLELSKEELLAEIGAFLQLDKNSRERFIGKLSYDNGAINNISGIKESLIAKIFGKISEEKLQELFNVEFLSENVKKNTSDIKHFSGEGRLSDAIDYSIEETEEEIEAKKEAQKKANEKKEAENNDPRFFGHGERIAAQERFKNGVVSVREYIKQLHDALPYLPFEASSNLLKSIEFVEQDLLTCEEYFNSSANNTQNTADAVIDHVSGDNSLLTKVQGYAQQLSRFESSGKNIFQNAWDNTRFLSGDNVVDIFKRLWDYVLRRHERKNKARVGEVGSKMFKGILPGLSADFEKEQNSAEMEEVDQFQEGYKLLADADLVDEIHNVNSEDALRAYLTEMASRGLIWWDREENGKKIYIEKLKEFGSGIRFYDSDFLDNEAFVNNKLQKAFIQVYDDENLFWDTYKDNKNNIEGKIKEAYDVAMVREGQVEQVYEWLYMHNNGEYVNPNDYEGYVKHMVDDGTTDPVAYIYMLFMGIRDGLLQDSALGRFYGWYGNTFPPSNGMVGWKKADIIKHMEPIMEGHHSWDGMPPLFVPWVHANIMTTNGVVERTTINLGQKNPGFDHDSADLLTSVGDAASASKYLALESTGALRFKDSMYNQTTLGMMQNITSVSIFENSSNLDFSVLQDTVLRQAGYFSVFDSLGNDRITSSKSKFKFTPDFLNRAPRASDNYNGGMVTKDYLAMGRTIFSSVKTPLFKELCDNFLFSSKNGNHEEIKKMWNEGYAKNPIIINEVFGGESPKLIQKEGDLDFTYIANAIFTYYLKDSPDAVMNVKSITSAARDIANGRGVSGSEESENWGYSTLLKDKEMQKSEYKGLLKPEFMNKKFITNNVDYDPEEQKKTA